MTRVCAPPRAPILTLLDAALAFDVATRHALTLMEPQHRRPRPRRMTVTRVHPLLSPQEGSWIQVHWHYLHLHLHLHLRLRLLRQGLCYPPQDLANVRNPHSTSACMPQHCCQQACRASHTWKPCLFRASSSCDKAMHGE